MNCKTGSRQLSRGSRWIGPTVMYWPPWIAYCDTYRATGDLKCIDAMLGAWQTYADNFLHVGGSAAICEDCDNAYPYRSYSCTNTREKIVAAHYGLTSITAFCSSIPDQERFASQIEQTIYNVTLANQDLSGNIRYHTNLVGTKDPARAIGTCCEVTNTTILARLPEFLYSITGDGLYVNIYAASTIQWKQNGSEISLQTSTEFPHDTNVSMKLSLNRPAFLKLRLRIPSWATGHVILSVNGNSVVTGKPGTYVTLSRTWSNADTINFQIPIGFRPILYAGFDRDPDHDRYALQYGPLLMALVGSTHLDIGASDLVGSLAPSSGSTLPIQDQ